MRNTGLLFLGVLLIFFGGLALVSEIFDVDFGTVCWPTVLILIGLFIMLRPRLIPAGTNLDIRPFGDVKRRGVWTVQNEEFWSFVGDTKLDMSEAELPAGETRLRVYGFVGDVRLRLPQQVGCSISSVAFLSETRIMGEKQDTFVAPFEYTSPGYESAERKIRLETWFFVANIRLEQVEVPQAGVESTSENP